MHFVLLTRTPVTLTVPADRQAESSGRRKKKKRKKNGKSKRSKGQAGNTKGIKPVQQLAGVTGGTSVRGGQRPTLKAGAAVAAAAPPAVREEVRTFFRHHQVVLESLKISVCCFFLLPIKGGGVGMDSALLILPGRQCSIPSNVFV